MKEFAPLQLIVANSPRIEARLWEFIRGIIAARIVWWGRAVYSAGYEFPALAISPIVV